MANLTETASNNRRYRSLLSEVRTALPRLEQRIENYAEEGSSDDSSSSSSTLSNRLAGIIQELDFISEELTTQGERIEELSLCGQELVATLERLTGPGTPKAEEIRASVLAAEEFWNRLQDEFYAKNQRLQRTVEDLERRETEYRNAVKRLDEIEESLTAETNAPISLDRRRLDDQAAAADGISKELASQKRRLESLAGAAGHRCHRQQQQQCGPQQQQQQDDERFERLVDRYARLKATSDARRDRIAAAIDRVTAFYAVVARLEECFTATVGLLRRDRPPTVTGAEGGEGGGGGLAQLYGRTRVVLRSDVETAERLAKELLETPSTVDDDDDDAGGRADRVRLRRTVADVREKWNGLDEILVEMLSASALREIDDLLKYLDRAESELSSAEPISANQDILTIQLREHRVFHEELEGHQKILNEVIAKCNFMLRETTNEEADDIRNKLASICEQADIVCQLSNSRLMILEEKLPLASYFSETSERLLSWLRDVQTEVSSVEVKDDETVEQVKGKQDRAKAVQRLVDDQKAVLDDVILTGQDLMAISTRDDAAGVNRHIEHVTAKYNTVKQSLRRKLTCLDETIRKLTTDMTVALDSIVDDLHYLNGRATHADPVAANPTSIRGQIAENQSIVEDLQICSVAISSVKDVVDQAMRKESESSEESEEILTELEALGELQSAVFETTRQRSALLESAVGVTEKFYHDYEVVLGEIKDIKEEVLSQASPGVEPEVVQQQIKRIQEIRDDLRKAVAKLDQCRRRVDEVARFCDGPGMSEIEKHLEDIDNLREEVEDKIKERTAILDVALERAENYFNYYKAIMLWMPRAEAKMNILSPIAAHPRSVRIQIEELKVLKIQLRPYYADIDNLNQYMSELRICSPIMADTLALQVREVNERWNQLLKDVEERESHLQEILVQLGEVNHAIDDIIGYLNQMEDDLNQFDKIYGDPGHVILHLRKIQKELVNLDPVIKKLNEVIQVTVERSGKTSALLIQKQDEMMNLYVGTQVIARDKLNDLHSRLKQVKGFMGSVDDLLSWFHNYQNRLKSTDFLGVLPEEAQRQQEIIRKGYDDLMEKEVEVQAIMLSSEDMLLRCRDKDAKQMKAKLIQLQERLEESKQRAEKRKRKMDGHMKAVDTFHKTFSSHIDWLEKAEKTLATYKNKCKTLDMIQQQIRDHEDLKREVEFHTKTAMSVENTGTYLKYFGCKRDTVYVKNLLVGVKIRWKKLIRKVDEAGRLLQQALREVKRFHDFWTSLLAWLDNGESSIKKHISAGVAKGKQDVDELRKFQVQMAGKHPVYHSTMRLGYSLREQCQADDAERAILTNMLDALKNKWNMLKSIAAQREVKLEEGLMSSGRLTDALQSLLDWLTKAESYLVDDQPILGDLDTVTILIEKHKLFQQEVSSRRSMVMTLLSSPGMDPDLQNQLQDLSSTWERVQDLTDLRESKLQESMKLAETFNDAIQVVRDWLPDAEAELKFQSIPDDEDRIMQLVENHEKFQEELQGQQVNIDKIRALAEEILGGCQPNAVRFVKYYLTITQTRWEQALNRSNQRASKLHEALKNCRTNTTIMEELLVWLEDGHALLSAKEEDTIPEDLPVVEALVKEHQEFHEELSSRSRDVERVVKALSSGTGSRRSLRGSCGKLADPETVGPKAAQLQSKWRVVWRMSVDRNKALHNMLSRLVEIESCRDFDFDSWRQRYTSWNRANKLKFMDFFRRQDRQGTGMMSRKEFVDSILSSKFPTNATELEAVFSVFDTRRNGRVHYKTFVDAIMRPDRQLQTIPQRPVARGATDAQVIQQEIEFQTTRCQCRCQFGFAKVDEGKYKFGDKEKLWHVRLINGTVFVRFGSSWMPLEEFVENNDPCRVRSRMTAPPRSALNSRLSKSARCLSQLGKRSDSVRSTSESQAGKRDSHLTKSLSNLWSKTMNATSPMRSNALASGLTLNSPRPRANAPGSSSSPSPRSPATPSGGGGGGGAPSKTSTWPRTSSPSSSSSPFSAKPCTSSSSAASPTAALSASLTSSTMPSRRPASHSTPSSSLTSPKTPQKGFALVSTPFGSAPSYSGPRSGVASSRATVAASRSVPPSSARDGGGGGGGISTDQGRSRSSQVDPKRTPASSSNAKRIASSSPDAKKHASNTGLDGGGGGGGGNTSVFSVRQTMNF